MLRIASLPRGLAAALAVLLVATIITASISVMRGSLEWWHLLSVPLWASLAVTAFRRAYGRGSPERPTP